MGKYIVGFEMLFDQLEKIGSDTAIPESQKPLLSLASLGTKSDLESTVAAVLLKDTSGLTLEAVFADARRWNRWSIQRMDRQSRNRSQGTKATSTRVIASEGSAEKRARYFWMLLGTGKLVMCSHRSRKEESKRRNGKEVGGKRKTPLWISKLYQAENQKHPRGNIEPSDYWQRSLNKSALEEEICWIGILQRRFLRYSTTGCKKRQNTVSWIRHTKIRKFIITGFCSSSKFKWQAYFCGLNMPWRECSCVYCEKSSNSVNDSDVLKIVKRKMHNGVYVFNESKEHVPELLERKYQHFAHSREREDSEDAQPHCCPFSKDERKSPSAPSMSTVQCAKEVAQFKFRTCQRRRSDTIRCWGTFPPKHAR